MRIDNIDMDIFKPVVVRQQQLPSSVFINIILNVGNILCFSEEKTQILNY